MRPTPPIDHAHLARQTGDDPLLAAELLDLFVQQCRRLTPLILEGAAAGPRADAAHTLKGAARAIGAFAVADAAEAVERCLGQGEADLPDDAREALSRASDAACAAAADPGRGS